MGDINWDKVDVEKFGTPESPSRKLLDSLKLKKRKRPKRKRPRRSQRKK